ncbi:CheA signal transduction histidine kinase [Anaeromyxobacter dehalogenans 2CP-1]|uniref:Chemotaxis protein CheA n=1 Tax=Anaeromyxobacter dehalogenans (strain ATCC BAA-258 / DSM 21875 / 2CP-1) TaxID=455488 RepID=B8JCI0_ANAD2|nr:chemotaxis protein CheA [Anaeromyxobacter dehalogenans]ACL65920.1 CheA signal transduction histidine kinase [Anaeromyxobacter dehalogenans 2CP-1]
MSGGPGDDAREALAAAVVAADAADPASLCEVSRALAAATAAGALDGALAAEAGALGRALDGSDGDDAGGAAAALARLSALLGGGELERPAAAEALPPAARASRDADTLELIGDFLEEGLDGLARADETLLAVERDGPHPDRTNALFRVFHTIKGVAGFLELGEIVSLAHTAETLLDHVRSGRAALAGEAFDVTFEATAALRSLLERLREAVDARADLLPDARVPGLVARIAAVSAAAEAAPEAAGEGTAPAMPLATDLAATPVATAAPTAAIPPPRPAPAPPRPAPAVEPEAAAEPASAAPAPPPHGGGQLRETVKVDLERVDSMVEMIGELIIVESMVVHAPELAAVASLRLRNSLNQMTKISRDLQNVAMRMRMVPVRGAFQKMARLVRDLSRRTGKDVVLETSGEDTEMDRSMVERIEDPLVHLVRNALDHGIEPEAERLAAGKAARSVLRLAAYHEGGSIVVELADDGRGLQRDRILRKARERGLVGDGQELSDAEVHGLVFLPGFSTAAKVTEISGRGVGMDVVKRNVEGMRGRVTVASRAGGGTTFRLVLPLTLAIIDGMLVSCGGETYILPSLSIVESLRPADDTIRRAAGRGEVIDVRGEILPLLRLHRLLGARERAAGADDLRVVVVEGLGRKVGLVVDDVVTQQQVVIKPLGSGLGDTDFLSGAAILSDGRVGLILNVDRLAGLASRDAAADRGARLAAGA